MARQCALLAVLLLAARARADNAFTHITRSVSACTVGPTGSAPLVVSAESQHAIALEWTYGHGVTDWRMSPWDDVAGLGPFAASPLAEGLARGALARHSQISYSTVLRLPRILASVVNVHQVLHVRKDLFAVDNKLYSFVDINNVPMLGAIHIGSVMTFYGNRRLVSRHDIRYDSFPWMLSWAADVLHGEIIKSIERVDMLSARHYCSPPA